ncbi:uncharacterized protein LOC127253925 [Andrographis paniculata]|uniref:uncharacterized protein LOC127253925 n=1 Tax=Andrographis paniculata TaxID=175694 RepID=UPI0021E89CA7|nr:uncharacterized protein LOC127253925 [Andrographis paniculata]
MRRSFTSRFSKTPYCHPDPGPDTDPHSIGGGPVSTGQGESIAGTAADSDALTPATSAEEKRKTSLMEHPPVDDVCPICFGNFVVPCRAPCGHWYCGSCILQYWNFSATLQPCKCPMCSQFITKLMPEASLYRGHEAEISKVLKSVGNYNRIFVGGISGFMLKVLAIPLSLKRLICEMLNPDRPGAYLHEMRLIAMFLGVLYSFIPFDFLRLGRHNIMNLLDYSAYALSFIFYLVGLYVRWRRQRNVRELAGVEVGHD